MTHVVRRLDRVSELMKEVELKSIAERAGRAAAAEAVYLFGSRANGLAREDSDFDFALILGDDADPWKATLEAQRALWPREFSVDIVPIFKRAWLTSKDYTFFCGEACV